MGLWRSPLADLLLETQKVTVGVLDQELPNADLALARPIPLFFGFDEDRPLRLREAPPRGVQIFDLNLEVDPTTKRWLKGGRSPTSSRG